MSEKDSENVAQALSRSVSLFSSVTSLPVNIQSTSQNNLNSPKNGESGGEKPGKHEKPEKEKKKKEPKPPGHVSNKQKKFSRHFTQVNLDDKVINYYSCALVSDILLQGHMYITQNYFAFYSNVFGFVTKLLIPTTSVINLTKERTIKFFPNAIGLETAEDRHVFGSFLSREAAFKLMCSVWSQAKLKMEHFDEIDAVSPDIEINDYSIEDDSSSISGNENFAQLRFKETKSIEDKPPEKVPPTSKAPNISAIRRPSMEPKSVQDVSRVIEYRRNSMDESISTKDRRLLIFGMVLAILLAIFSSFLLLKINNFPAEPEFNLHDFSKDFPKDTEVYSEWLKFQNKIQSRSIDEAQKILDSNMQEVKKVRQSLETLQTLLQDSFAKFPPTNKFATNEKQDF